MECRDLILDGLARVEEGLRSHLAPLSREQLGVRLSLRANPIGWLAWHLTRVQDSHIAELAQTPQVWLAEGWHDRFGRPREARDTGYGESAAQVGAFKAPHADVLLAYHAAVHQRSIEYLKGLSNADFDRVVDKRWDPPVTMGVRLVSIVDDCTQHVGQIGYVRGLLE